MVTSEYWDRIVYKYPKLAGRGKQISRMLGIDSEALTTGEPFMFCMSDGTTFTLADLPRVFFRPRYLDKHIAVYNLKYDSGAILYRLPDGCKVELWEKTVTYWALRERHRDLSLPPPLMELDEKGGPIGEEAADRRTCGRRSPLIKVEYIPHKALILTHGKHKVYFWDVSQYYASSLDVAAKNYLKRRKLDIETKFFTPAYVKAHWRKIRRYCIQDAALCADLGTYFVKKVKEFGIRATALYSSASLSFRYFSDRVRIVTAWRFWKNYKPILRAGIDAYEGGKFEVTARGTFDGVEYDIVSAYPYEIANLRDVSLSKVVRSRRYVDEAVYAFLRCHIRNPRGVPVPCGVMIDKVRVYPAGRWFATITKAEYDYLTKEAGLDVDILDGYWLICRTEHYPYRDTIMELFALKARYKGKDAMLYEVSKRMLNSFYGKTVQMIGNWRGEIVAGCGWMPLYGAIITANTRLAVTRIQAAMGRDCVAVHTDSVILRHDLEAASVTGKLGGFDFVERGQCTVIACGQYAIGDKAAYKGFEPLHGEAWERVRHDNRDRSPAWYPPEVDDWRAVLSRNGDRSRFPYPVRTVESWVEAIAKGHFTTVNLFSDREKEIDLNGDTKRIWMRVVCGADLLEGIEYSLSRPYIEHKPPAHWGL